LAVHRGAALGVTFSDVEDARVGRAPGEAAAPEATLAARIAGGDLDALGEAYDALHEHVRTFARRLAGEDAAAEDLVQETFLSLPRALKGYRGESPLRTFVIGVAANHARHHVRAAARRRAAMQRVEREPPASGHGPESGASARELALALARALDELPLEQRVAIVLCEVEERTAGEVAKMTGVPEGTVRTRVFHGKKKLREVLVREGLR
jgi:RNA polymerase sigma-70 factor (ECF subfamily)